jgi:hypothetical protein
VYQLIIDKASAELEPHDPKVSKTIEDLVKRFFNNTQNSMIYICSDDGEKAQLRFEIFDRWYKKSDYRAFVVKIDSVIKIKISDTEIQKMYTSFLYHKNNDSKQKLVEIYSQIERTLNGEK